MRKAAGGGGGGNVLGEKTLQSQSLLPYQLETARPQAPHSPVLPGWSEQQCDSSSLFSVFPGLQRSTLQAGRSKGNP